MKKRINLPFFAGLTVVGFWVASTIRAVGETPSSLEPFSWGLPLAMVIVVVPPFILGYWAGKD